MGIVKADEDTVEFDNITGNAPRDPKHRVYTVTYNDTTDSEGGRLKYQKDGINDGVTELGCAIVAWGSYPSTPENLLIKIKRNIEETDEDLLFPKITITMRPLYCDLDYAYIGNANKSGEGEVGYESQNTDDDLYSVAYWEGSEIPAPNWYDGTLDLDNSANYEAYRANEYAFAQYAIDEIGVFPLLEFSERHYWKNKDRPSSSHTPWEPQEDWDIEPTIYPHIETEGSYDFVRNESYDCRYRYPRNYFEKYGNLRMEVGDTYGEPEFFIAYEGVLDPDDEDGETYVLFPVSLGTWKYTHAQQDPDNPIVITKTNPLFEPSKLGNTFLSDEGIAPIVKGWYWDGSSPPQTNKGMYSLVASENYKVTKDIRKRYCYSFRLKGAFAPALKVFDHLNANTGGNVLGEWRQNVDGGQVSNYKYAEGASYYLNAGKAVELGYLAGSFDRSDDTYYNCDAVWAMEVNCKVEDWNFKDEETTDQYTGQKKTVKKGATISGYISLAQVEMSLSVAQQGLYSSATADYDTFSGINSWISPSVVFRAKRRQIDVDEQGTPIYEVVRMSAGQIEWSITLTEQHAKGKPVKFKDIYLVPPEAEAGLPNTGNGTMLYITDFVVTSVTPP